MRTQHSQSGGASQRQRRVGEEIRHLLSTVFTRGELGEPELDAQPITVSEVRISPDLKNATAYVMPLGGMNSEGVLNVLERLAGTIRKLVSSRMRLRYCPRIHFELDRSFDQASHIDALLRRPEVARDLDSAAAQTAKPE